MKKQEAKEVLNKLKIKGYLKNRRIEKTIYQEIVITNLKSEIEDLNYETKNLLSKICEINDLNRVLK